MKSVKVLLGLLVGAAVIVVLVVVLALQNINEIVKTAVETVGPKVVGTEVRLAEVEIQLSAGRGDLKGLSVANPAGYQKPHAFSLGEIALDIDPASLTKDVVVIDEILVSAAQLVAEYKDTKNNNLQSLLDNIQSGSGTAKETSAPQTEAESAPSDVLLAVRKFTFEGTTIDVVTPKWGERKVTLPAIHLSDLGSPSKGLTPEQLTQTVIKQLLDQAKKAVSSDLKTLAKDKAKKELKEKLAGKISAEDKEKLEGLKSLFKR